MHAEPAAMQDIVDALQGLSKASAESVARKILLTSDAEILALGKILTALQGVQGVQARTRVIRWAMDAYKAPKQARKPRKTEEPKKAEARATDRDRTIDLRPAASA